MQKYFGCGQMLHPEIGMVEDVIALIPKGKITTINILTKQLADLYGVDVTCPMRTGNHLKRLSKTDSQLPFWRVVRKDGTMVKFKDYEHWATVLEKEGFELKFTKSNQVSVVASESQLFRFKKIP
ncbi:MGMT family protein [Maribacter sp.]|nr:MGMT family protein [Maribacter sp.]